MYYKSFIQTIKDGNDSSRYEITDESFKNNTYFFTVYLKPLPNIECPRCQSHSIIRFGKKSRTFKDEYFSSFNTFVTLNYHRFKCGICQKMFCDSIPMLNPKQSISITIKLNVLEDLKHDCSFTSIANKRNISIQTVIDIFESYISFDRLCLTDVVCMDEFKNLKHSNGKYAFVLYDPNSHKILDILPNRIQKTIDDYFYSISWDEKNKVKYVITDMSESYRTIIKRHFRYATHIIDSFHFIRYVEDALNDVRIRIQGTFKDTDPRYKILKKYWRILSAYSITIETNDFYNPIKKKNTTIEVLIDDAVGTHVDFEKAFKLAHSFLRGLREVKYENAEKWLDSWLIEARDSGLKEFHNLRNMFFNWKLEILNSFIRFGDKRLHNGYIEGINNKIKVIKRISFGYSNFTHFRNRLMYVINQDVNLKNVNRELISRNKRKKEKSIIIL